ncbi:secreted 5'-nucleotidase [gut metagenome]|uniref:Secreted 5'-nucleotidase n=1 Tax=gut metagenome TaxID=749906 RepID=J9G4J7_9ZZZZ
MGGVARRAAFIKSYRKQHPKALLFDCGDISQGTPYYNFFQGELEVKAMNLMGYDAMAIGNHEFDFGMDNLARLCRLANFPILSANYDVTGTVLEGLVKPYVVLQREGLKIGVFGISPKLEGLVQADKCAGITYKDPVASATEVITWLKEKEGCEVVICLSHLGIRSGSNATKGYDNELVAKTKDIDLILGGHTHTFMEKPVLYINAAGLEVPIMHVGKNGIYVGEICLTVSEH